MNYDEKIKEWRINQFCKKQKLAIITCIEDIAGMNELMGLLKLNPNYLSEFEKIIGDVTKENIQTYVNTNEKIEVKINDYLIIGVSKQTHIYLENPEQFFEGDCFIILSKHSARNEENILSVHPVGNFEKAMLGGSDHILVPAMADIMKVIMILMEDYREEIHRDDFMVYQEATHHGPFSKKPLMFVEVGSTPNAWHDLEICFFVSKAVNKIILMNESGMIPIFEKGIGLGGLHTSTKFRKIMLTEPYAIGHILPKYMQDNITEKKIEEMLTETVRACAESEMKYCFVDWKGISRPIFSGIEPFLVEKGLEIKKYR